MHCPVIRACQYHGDENYCTDMHREKLSHLISSDEQLHSHNCEHIRLCRGGVMPFVEKLAQEQLNKGYSSKLPIPTDLISLADEQHIIEVRAVRLNACNAATWRLKDRWVIHVSDRSPSFRLRMTLFHEAFHIMAHCRSQSVPVFSNRKAIRGYFNEFMADYFAICMLMPLQLIKDEWAIIGNVDRMAQRFRVPNSAMLIRLCELGLLD